MRGAVRGAAGGDKSKGSPAPTSTSTSTQPGDPNEAPADGGETAGESDADGGAEGDPVRFDQVQPILEKYCTGCHNPTGNNPDLTSYSRARIVGQHIVRTSAADIPAMPLGPEKLSEDEKKILRAWRAGGFEE
jgi:uncharacterized membrane protein